MPTYEFRCPAGHTFDRFFSRISDAPSEVECPECHQIAQRQISGGAGFAFKGSGFYLTDYGKNAHRTNGPAASGGESKPSESKPSSSESKSSDLKGSGSSGSSTPKSE